MEDQKTKENTFTRRKFLTNAGGVAFIVVSGALVPRVLRTKDEVVEETSGAITAWVHVHPDEKITIYNPATEMGQGSMTATVAILAEEMDIEWGNVIIKHAPLDPEVYGKPGWGPRKNMINAGSSTIPQYYKVLRQAGAQARYVMMYNAAKKWQVKISELSTAPGKVLHASSGKHLTYAQIAGFAEIPDPLPEIPESEWKKRKDFRYIGTSIPRPDVPGKVDGGAKYSIDIHLPGMVYGVMSRSPVNGASPNLLNEKAIKNIPGMLEVVHLEHGIGVIADSIEVALKAKQKLLIQWSEDAKAASHNSVADLEGYAIKMDAPEKGDVLAEQGDVDAALAANREVFSRDYKNDYAYHAHMEPLNAVIHVAEDGQSVEAWVGSQNHPGAKTTIAETVGVPLDKVKYHACMLGGGFGRRSMSDYVMEAAALGKAIKRPLKFIWTREDDVKYGAFRPMSLQRIKATINDAGDIEGWWYGIAGTGGGLLGSGARSAYYHLPHHRIEIRHIDHGIRTKHWRGVAHGPNKFAIEAFIDELAGSIKEDPVRFRRRLMKDNARALHVLDKVVQMSNWASPVAVGRAKGLAFIERSGSLVGGVAEISIDHASGKINVHHIWTAIDAGIIVQKDNALAQSEGAIIMGLSSILSERITFLGGEVEQSNYNDYQVMRMADAPESINITFIDSDEKPEGIGEAALPVVGGAVANAFAKLTGKRLYHMPFTPERVLDVLHG